MKTNVLVLALLAAIAAPAAAQEIQDLAPIAAPATESYVTYVTVKDLADETGLSENRVRMVVGPRSGNAEYRVTFARSQRQFKNALGEERYNDLMAGRRIELRNQKSAAIASVDTKHTDNPVTTP